MYIYLSVGTVCIMCHGRAGVHCVKLSKSRICQKRPTYAHKRPIFTQKTVKLSKSRICQKSPAYVHKRPIVTQKRPIYMVIGLIFICIGCVE